MTEVMTDLALTDYQPWADLIMAGGKDVENRTWPVPSTLPQWRECQDCDARWAPGDDAPKMHRCTEFPGNWSLVDAVGPFPFRLWIHSAKSLDRAPRTGAAAAWEALSDAWGLPMMVVAPGARVAAAAMARARNEGRYGALLGSVTVTGCHHAADCWNWAPIGDMCSRWAEPGAVWHWVLADPVALPEPIPLRGRQRLWTLPEDVAEQARRQVAA